MSADSAAAGRTEVSVTFRMNPEWLDASARHSHDMTGNRIHESNAITQTTRQRRGAGSEIIF